MVQAGSKWNIRPSEFLTRMVVVVVVEWKNYGGKGMPHPAYVIAIIAEDPAIVILPEVAQ